jgi:hypothetical protein
LTKRFCFHRGANKRRFEHTSFTGGNLSAQNA